VLTPFSALALALVLGALWVAHGRPPRQAAAHPDGAAPPGPVDVLGLAGIRLDASAESVLGRRIAIVVYLAVALVVSVLFFPVWSGQPVAEWFWRAHLWLPGWE
jgi:dolichyl-phosphate-mannose--protein O-mannosyl transferase